MGWEGDVLFPSKLEHAELPNLMGLGSVWLFQKEGNSSLKVSDLHGVGRLGFSVQKIFMKAELSV